MNRSKVLKYFIENYFESIDDAAAATGYTQQQIDSWVSGTVTPQKDTIEYLVHTIFTPEFKIVAEYAEFDGGEKIRPQLKAILGGHSDEPGLYAFYDSLGNLIYLGKATNLLDECYQSIRRKVDIEFPKGVQTAPEKRYEIVRYISAYDVGNSDWVDYPHHVESLILRISKPLMNIRIGSLEPAFERQDD